MDKINYDKNYGEFILYKSNYNVDVFNLIFYLIIFINILFFDFKLSDIWIIFNKYFYTINFAIVYFYIKKKLIWEEKLILIKGFGIILQKKYLNKSIKSSNIQINKIKDCLIIEHIGSIRVKNKIVIEKNNNKLKLLTNTDFELEQLIQLRKSIKEFFQLK